jgi:hypothetical protein
MRPLDRTNRNDAFIQIQTATRAAFDRNEELLSISPEATYPAIVLASQRKFFQNDFGRGLEAVLEERYAIIGAAVEKYKIYFRVPTLHAHLPLPPSFRNIVLPENSPKLKGHNSPTQLRRDGSLDPNAVFSRTYTGDYLLKPEAEEALLVGCHPYLWVSLDPSDTSSMNAKLTPGDVIEIKFSGGAFSNAKIIKIVSKGADITKKFDFAAFTAALDMFEGGGTFDMSDFTKEYEEQPMPGYPSNENVTATTTELLDKIRYSAGKYIDENGIEHTIASGQRKNADLIVDLFKTNGLSPNMAMAAVANAYNESLFDNQICVAPGRAAWGPDRLKPPPGGSLENSCGLFQLNAARKAAGAGMSPDDRKNASVHTQRIIDVITGNFKPGNHDVGTQFRAADKADAPLSELIWLFTRYIENPASATLKAEKRAAKAEDWWKDKIQVVGSNLTY